MASEKNTDRVSDFIQSAKERVKKEAKELKNGLQELSQDIDHEITMIGKGLSDDKRD